MGLVEFSRSYRMVEGQIADGESGLRLLDVSSGEEKLGWKRLRWVY